MSLTVSTPAQIANSPSNNSKSKQLYSFPKSKRLEPQKPSLCAQPFYDLPPIRSNRSTGFGFSNKYDFTQGQARVPAPNAYTLKDDFAVLEKKGFSFGLSREAVKVNNPLFVGDKNSPGPGAYDTRESNKVTHAYSIRAKTKLSESATNLKTPGPGTYQPPSSISADGEYYLAKFKNSGALSFPPAHSKRFHSLKQGDKPGPGAYETNPGFSKNGSYFVSAYKSSLGKSFGGSLKKNDSTSNFPTPGPGQYKLPSDFGHYEAAPKSAT